MFDFPWESRLRDESTPGMGAFPGVSMSVRTILLLPLALLVTLGASAQTTLTPEARAEFARRAFVKQLSKQPQKGFHWTIGGTKADALVAISDGAMLSDEVIKTLLDDKDVHDTLRKARFTRIVFSDRSTEIRKAFVVMQDGYTPTPYNKF